MNNLSTEIKNNVIVFYDDSTRWLTEEEFKQFFLAWLEKGVENYAIGQNIYQRNSIKKVLTREEYYIEYPQQQPEPELPKVSTLLFENPRNVAKTDNAIKSMLRGIDRYISESKTTNPVVFELRKRMEKSAK